MDGYTLEAVLLKDPHAAPYFAGVFASDTLPRTIQQKPALIIVNTDPIKRPGAHWQAIYLGCYGRGEHFCSYGLGPYVPKIRQFMDLCSLWKKNTIDLQSIDSAVCGQYCTMYLLFKAHGFSMQEFLSYFTTDCNQNDEMVNKMFQRYAKN
ncbi:Protease, partial [Frankliniella fusca]